MKLDEQCMKDILLYVSEHIKVKVKKNEFK